MEKSKQRLEILEKIEQLEREERWHEDVENDPESKELLPNEVDYLNKKISSKIKTFIANRLATSFYEKLIKNGQFIIDKIVGIENFCALNGGAIITCNHFSMLDNYAVWRIIKPYMKGKLLYRVIREGNYTNSPPPYGFLMRHCTTLPLSSNVVTMKHFMQAVKTLLGRGEKILVYPEQGMWWNYRKPRPLQDGAFKLATMNNVPVLPMFITMEDSDTLDGDGFPVQKFTMHVLPAIYPNQSLKKKDQLEQMKKENYDVWVKTYEQTYGVKLEYLKN